MIKKRNRLEIAHLVLKLIRDNRNLTKSKLLVKANLSFTQANGFLSELIKQNAIEVNPNIDNRTDGHYRITNKGRELLSQMDSMNNLFCF